MVDSRKWIIALALVLLCAGLASAQTGGGGGTQFTCSVNTSSTPTLRSEGITEQVGDIVITCTGGQDIPNTGTGASMNPLAPAVNITVSLTSQVTSRLVSGTVSEALLLIDEPNSGLPGPVPGWGPHQAFFTCQSASATQNGCAGSGSSTPVYTMSQSSTNTVCSSAANCFQTGVTSASATPGEATAGQNIYHGVVSGNQVTFYGVPVIPPGTNASRVFRITNVRVNASGVGGGSASGSLPVQASILTSNPSALPITNPQPIVGFVQQSLSTSAVMINSFGQCNGQCLALAGTVTFKELFASAFKTRVDPTVTGQVGANPPTATSNGGVGQGNALVQNVPGTIYNSESGFTLQDTVNTSTSTATVTSGLADYSTRFTAVFNNVPAGVHLYVSQFGNSTGTGTATSGSFAQAITSETAADGPGTIPAATTFTPPSNCVPGTSVAVVDITPTSGNTATATWESVSNSPTALDTYIINVYISYTASPGTNSPASGTGTVNLRYGPASTVTTAASGPIPRFLDTSSAKNIITIGICRTVLLFPFVTEQAGFDTGLAISNTSTDPFGTTPQSGTCSLNWYGAAAPATPTTTPVIPSATSYTTLASVTVPGFQGYMIAVCNFQYAHGFAFISDLGARNLAMGYLALVIPDPNLNGPARNANGFNYAAMSSGEQLGQ